MFRKAMHMGTDRTEIDGSLIKNAFLLFDKMSELQKKLPVAYAVFQMILNENGDGAADAKYLYANDRYCHGIGYTRDELVGNLVTETYKGESRELLDYGYQAAFYREEAHHTTYSKELNHWIEFIIAPTNIEGCCIVVSTFIDDSHLERELLRRNSTTDDAIVRITRLLNQDENFERTMDMVLNEISLVVHPSRLDILTFDGVSVNYQFEWCADGVSSKRDKTKSIGYDTYFSNWKNYANHGDVVQIEDIKVLEKQDNAIYLFFKSLGVERIIAAPFYDNHHNLLGFLCAENYETNEEIDTLKLIESISYFIAFRIRNHHLLQLLDYRATHDELTGLRNRRVFGERLKELSKGNDEYGIFYIDLNFFKNANDQYGHHVGNEVLMETSRRLERASGFEVFRIGGDEFAILVDEALDEEDYIKIVHVMNEFFEKPVVENKDFSINISISVGYARAPYDSRIPNELRKIADMRMYEQKKMMHKLILDEQGKTNKSSQE